MPEKTCADCRWFVDDSEDDIDNYTHEHALEHGEGFCLLRDLFWDVKSETKACEEFEK